MRYRKTQGARPVKTITGEVVERALYAKGGHGAVNESKALKPVFEHLRRLGFIRKDPLVGIELENPRSKAFLSPTLKTLQPSKSAGRWALVNA